MCGYTELFTGSIAAPILFVSNLGWPFFPLLFLYLGILCAAGASILATINRPAVRATVGVSIVFAVLIVHGVFAGFLMEGVFETVGSDAFAEAYGKVLYGSKGQ